MNIKWNADKYNRDFSFVHQYGQGVIDLIDFNGKSTAIDLGCGNGVLTKALKEKGLSVTGIDSSEEQLRIARELYPDISFIAADAVSLSVRNPVDIVFSNAVFHWIDKDKQQTMLSSISRSLKEGGQLVFEMGGHGNNSLIHSALSDVFERHGYIYIMPFYFPSIGEYSAMLEAAGMEVTYAVLFERPTELKGDNGLADWIRMFIRTPFSIIGDKEEENTIILEAADILRKNLFKNGKWYLDYVRLRMKAIKSN